MDFQSDTSCECCNLNGIRAYKSSVKQRHSVAKKEGEVFSTEFSYVAPILEESCLEII